MKIAIVNFSGNVGKSTIARNLLKPRVAGAKIISVETINSDTLDEQRLKGKYFLEILEELHLSDDTIVDVGASNIEEFIRLMGQYDGSQDDFDFFLIPVVGDPKPIRDTIGTINTLSVMGVAPSKIKTIFNRLEPDEPVEKVFSSIFRYHEKMKSFTLRPKAAIIVSEIYRNLTDSQTTLEEILADETDYKAKLRETNDIDEKVALISSLAMKRLASSAKKNLDLVFEEIMR